MRFTLIAVFLLFPGCDFFKELQSENTDETGTDDADDEADDEAADETADGTDDGPCDVLDEHCEDQDTLVTCDPDSGELITTPCTALCGDFLNFTCTPSDQFIHGCWCVTAGNIKLKTCSELEACIYECGDTESACSQACFGDTDATTIRLLGTLWSCADLACDDLCAEFPADCSSCLASARAGLWGDCGIERSVCDTDELDDQPWP